MFHLVIEIDCRFSEVDPPEHHDVVFNQLHLLILSLNIIQRPLRVSRIGVFLKWFEFIRNLRILSIHRFYSLVFETFFLNLNITNVYQFRSRVHEIFFRIGKMISQTRHSCINYLWNWIFRWSYWCRPPFLNMSESWSEHLFKISCFLFYLLNRLLTVLLKVFSSLLCF